MHSIVPSALFSDVHDAIEVIVADDKCSLQAYCLDRSRLLGMLRLSRERGRGTVIFFELLFVV